MLTTYIVRLTGIRFHNQPDYLCTQVTRAYEAEWPQDAVEFALEDLEEWTGHRVSGCRAKVWEQDEVVSPVKEPAA